jgi:hypothetical protein
VDWLSVLLYRKENTSERKNIGILGVASIVIPTRLVLWRVGSNLIKKRNEDFMAEEEDFPILDYMYKDIMKKINGNIVLGLPIDLSNIKMVVVAAYILGKFEEFNKGHNE